MDEKNVEFPYIKMETNVKSTYNFNGIGNKLLLLRDGQYVEQKEKIPGLEIDIQGGNNSTIRLDDVSIISGILQITIRDSDCSCHIGKGTDASYPARITGLGIYLGCRGARVDIGDRPIILHDVVMHLSEPYCQCLIGNNVRIAENTKIFASDGHPVVDVFTHKVLNYGAGKRVLSIGDFSWIGQGSFIGKNGCMPDHTIVGAHSVVVRPVKEPYCVVAGNPAKIVKSGVMRVDTWEDAFKLERESHKYIDNVAPQMPDHRVEINTLKDRFTRLESYIDVKPKQQETERNSTAMELKKEPTSEIDEIRTLLLRHQTYIEFLLKRETERAQSRLKEIHVLRDIALLPITWLNLQRCRFASHLFFGKLRTHYTAKKRCLREKITIIQNFLRD